MTLIYFWYRLKTHLEPLARAANVAQAAFCRLDQILLTFGSLSIYYKDIKAKDPANDLGCTAILDSIEKRWEKVDQDVFIAAVILNPFVKTAAFSAQVRFLTRAGVLALMKRLYQRFFSITDTTEEFEENMQRLFSNVEDYFAGSGICADITQYVSAINDEAQRNGISPDPLMVYHGISPIASSTPPPLFKLAYHILSICPNSASCERLFSVFGNTLTKLRNRLGNQTLTSLAELKMHIRDEHVRDGEIKQRMKRFFGATTAPSAAPVSSSTVPHVPQQPTTSAPSTAETETDVAMEIDPELQNLQSPDDGTDEFNQITELFARQTRADEDDGDGQMPSVISIEIAKLFNFMNKSWIPSHERSASRSLDEELELYELLDLDAPGEDINIEIDHTLDSILHV
jgi:hypothetical protein